jgi:hypothetical protein
MATKTVTFEIPLYIPGRGLDYHGMTSGAFEVALGSNEICINADKEGLLTLARFLINLAQDGVPAGKHVHFDPGVELTEGSVGLVVSRF